VIAQKLHQKIQKYVVHLERFADRAWYPPLIGLLAALDSLVMIIPTDGILIASTMIIPRRWFINAVFVTIGSTIGALVLCAIVENHGLPFILKYYPTINESATWAWTERVFEQYGLLLVFAIGASPLMQHPVVILAGLADTRLLPLAAAIFLGRSIKYAVMAYLASHSPKLLKKIWGLQTELDDAGVKID
jgi:membrane protein YqaA with SNARE-associated domain